MGRKKSDVCWITSEVFTFDDFGHLGQKLIIGGGQVALAKEEKKDLQDIHVVREYPDVFLTNYFGLPPQRSTLVSHCEECQCCS
jgi:hypothetical protein